jgi:nitroreductase
VSPASEQGLSVEAALARRRSVRAFTDEPVSLDVLRRLVAAASRAPSGGNLQPWRLYCLTGEPLADLRSRMRDRLASGAEPDPPAYPIYPSPLPSPYRERRAEVGEGMYALLGIPREDRVARARWFARNFELFGASVGIFLYVDPVMGRAQWSDLGMFLQSLMLLLEEHGLASCAQEAWSLHHRTVAETVAPEPGLTLFCGLAVGHADPTAPVNGLRAARAPLEEFASFWGWPTSDA